MLDGHEGFAGLLRRQYGFWVPRGRPSPKLAITVDADVLERARAAASDDGISVSTWMTTAVRRSLVVRDGLRAVDEWEAENGAFTASELAAARRRVAGEGSAPTPLRAL